MQNETAPSRLVDYAALHASVIAKDPFAHIVVRNFVPASALRDVVASLPEMKSGGSFPTSSLRLGSAAAALMREMQGSVLRHAIAGKFGLDLAGAGTMLTLRGRSRAKDGRIHHDSEAKRITALLYLNPADAAWSRQGGSLRLLRGASDIDDAAVEVPPVDGTLLVFPNSPSAWHGHLPFEGRRYVVQLNYMAAGSAAAWEMRRHRVSALFKRLARAA